MIPNRWRCRDQEARDRVAEARKESLLREFDLEGGRLRAAAAALNALDMSPVEWGPREVLAHITLWAVQAEEHFRLHLPPLDYGNSGIWRADMFGTFDAAFALLSEDSTGAAPQSGWDAVARAGVILPLTEEETPEEHLRVDEAFNVAAVELTSGRPFDDVLRLTEEAHRRLLRLLEQAPTDEFEDGRYLHARLLLIIEHHVEHRADLERQITGAANRRPGGPN